MPRECGRASSWLFDIRIRQVRCRAVVVAASACGWRPSSFELFRDVIILARDTGMRNQRELYCMRTENLDWNKRIIFVPDSKTANGRRMIAMSDRVYELLRVRAEGKGEGWLFPSNRSRCGHLTDLAKQFRTARAKAGLAKDLVLYCSRHDYGTRVLNQTGNLAAVMKTMGHKDVRTAMQYQHPELEIVRTALNRANGSALPRIQSPGVHLAVRLPRAAGGRAFV